MDEQHHPMDCRCLNHLTIRARSLLPLSADMLEHMFRGVSDLGVRAFSRDEVMAAIILQARQQAGRAPHVQIPEGCRGILLPNGSVVPDPES